MRLSAGKGRLRGSPMRVKPGSRLHVVDTRSRERSYALQIPKNAIVFETKAYGGLAEECEGRLIGTASKGNLSQSG